MFSLKRPHRGSGWIGLGLLCLTTEAASPTSLSPVEFFEQRIRPVLVNECYECHGAKKQKGGLRLDFREGLLKGGDSGPAIIPGEGLGSLLIQKITHARADSSMPKDRPKLADAVLADFVVWVNQGAPDPRDQPPPDLAANAIPWSATFEARKDWWSFQPVGKPVPPDVPNTDGSNHPVDAFLRAKMAGHGLRPSADADPDSLLRRVTFALTGLPPTPDELRHYRSDSSPDAYPKVVDRLLASPRFGERWARHWMDLVRYCESHGSQGDPELPMAWRYRDYLIRAFNQDVPYDQLVREHIAGDLLPQPRLDRAEGLNESILGTAQLRMVEYGFVPVDALDDQVKVVDNQIDVFSKVFLGLTVSCARCHDHKFDPISQTDFYALYGIFASSRPGQVVVDTPEVQQTNRAEMAALKMQIREGLADAWRAAASGLPIELQAHTARTVALTQLEAGQAPEPAGDPWKSALAEAAQNDASPLHAWTKLSGLTGDAFRAEWRRLVTHGKSELEGRREFNRTHFTPAWNLRGDGVNRWFMAGATVPTRPALAGEFSVEISGDPVLRGLYPSGVLTHALTRKQNGAFASPRFKVETDSISVRAFGEHSTARLVVENYALGNGGIYPGQTLDTNQMSWLRLDTTYRKGAHAYLEFVTADDFPKTGLRSGGRKMEGGRAYFGAAEVMFHNGPQPPKETLVPSVFLLAGKTPDSAATLAGLYGTLLTDAVLHWREQSLSDEELVFLDYFVRRDLLPTSLPQLPQLRERVAAYRQLEVAIPVPRRAPGVHEGAAFNQPLFQRGQPNKLGNPVPRRFLELFGSQPYHTGSSGRLELAHDVANGRNPLTARIMVNRLWYHLFGRGLVGTVDNFGHLGEKPTHPELLDYLATRFVEHGWSVKEMIRFLVTAQAYRQSSVTSTEARRIDPGNEWLSHGPVRRLEAEAIRDAVLAVSGQLDPKMYGPGVDVYYVGKTEGGGPKGPLDGDRRRSVYQRIRRNAHNPFLEAFDTPKPASTRGKRDATNVPAQSLTLLNDPFVIDQSAKWAQAVVRDGLDREERVRAMFLKALGREIAAEDLTAAREFLDELAGEHSIPDQELNKSERVWQDFAQSIFCLKKFIYVD